MNRPRGLDGIVRMFGDPRKFIRDDGSLDPEWEMQALMYVDLPFGIPLAWDLSRSVRRIRVNRIIAPEFAHVFWCIDREGLAQEIKNFGGTYAWRAQRGSNTKVSTHAWGIAIDLNTDTNQLGTQGDMSNEIIRIFESQGFYWGGRFSRQDPMHFQMADSY